MKNKKGKWKMLFLGCFLIIFFWHTPVFGEDELEYKMSQKIPGQEETENDFISYLSALYKFGIGSAAFLALFMIALGAFIYLVTSAGNASKMADAKGMIFNALYGLILVMLAWLILYLINPDMLDGEMTAPMKNVDAVIDDGQD